ncbi:unnamed protein product [Polarella glacialis]|uniref:Phosphohydrolase n=1 Tax=Polarella glacialis TaxID=89957 RepID=A0A813EV25_POLGL|nr:unnamed protein product [Polarella glacialis]
MAERALAMVEQLKGVNIGNLVDQHEHAMQTATRALRDGADEETVVVAVLHDIGEIMTPINHGEVAGALLRPYISPENYWILMHHEVFQAFYYQDAAGLPEKNARDMLRSSPHFDACERFCNDYDQPSFDPDYESLPLEHFAPMVRRVFAKTPYWHADHEAKMRIMGAYPMPDEPDPSAEPAAKKDARLQAEAADGRRRQLESQLQLRLGAGAGESREEGVGRCGTETSRSRGSGPTAFSFDCAAGEGGLSSRRPPDSRGTPPEGVPTFSLSGQSGLPRAVQTFSLSSKAPKSRPSQAPKGVATYPMTTPTSSFAPPLVRG